MQQNPRTNTRRSIYRLAVLLISTVAIGHALALSEPEKPVPVISGENKPVPEAKERRVVTTPRVFVPSEKVSADKAVSFPTDI